MRRETDRKTPEDFLRDVQAEEARAVKRGYLKIFLGYASGVGKTVRMLNEACRRSKRGQDVIVGAIQPNVGPEAEELLQCLEVIPLKPVGSGAAIDVDTIVKRRPAICIIDGLAYDNPPGARNAARWQDVQELVRAGTKVIGSINIQFIDGLREAAEAITGKHVKETVPIAFLESADEIEIVDAPLEDPVDRLAETKPEIENRSHRLARLREMALVLVADVIDRQLVDYLEREGIHQQFGAQERILVCITPRANVEEMIETGQIISERFHGQLIVAYVNQPQISKADQVILDQKLAIASAASAHVNILDGDDPIEAIVQFARSQRVTQIFIGHSQRTGLWSRLWGNPVDKLIRLSQGMDVRIFPQ